MNFPLRDYSNLLVTYLRPQAGKALLLAVLLFSSIGLQLLNPQIVRYFIDTAAAGGAVERLIVVAILFLAVGFLDQMLSALVTYVGADVGWTATNQMRADLAMHCLRLDMPFHNDRTPGELIERIDGDITALSNFFSEFVIRVLGSGLLLIGVLVLLFREDWRVGLGLTFFSVTSVFALNRARNVAVPAITEEREATARLFGFLEERLAGIDDIRANGAGAYTMRRFYDVLRRLYFRARRAWILRSVMWLVMMVMFTAGTLIALGLGAYLYMMGAVTLGTVYLFYQYNEMLRGPVEQLTRQLQDLQKATASIGRVRELLATEQNIRDGWGASPAPGVPTVEFDNVSFAYGEGESVLEGVSFRLEAGRVLGLLGRTGSGKTTLTRLLFRLYDIREGTIRLNGVDVRSMRIAELRRHIGMVTQDVQLFHATVRDNLTFFDESLPDERVVQVLQELGLGPWFASLDSGLDTMLDSGGGGLSAGEAQLLAFARVFLRDPGLVILDEPSSRMDPATERLIERAVDRLLRERTCIIIAHRLATVQRADDILIMDEGRLREHGRRERLARDTRSRFYQLLQTGLEEVAA